MQRASERASEEGGREGEQKHLGLDGGRARGRRTGGERGDEAAAVAAVAAPPSLTPPSIRGISSAALSLALSLAPLLPLGLSLSPSPSLQMLLVEGNRQSSVAHSSSFLPSFFRAHWLARSQVSSRAECFIRDTDIVTVRSSQLPRPRAVDARSKRPPCR